MSRFNKADALLCVVTIIFAILLILKIKFPDVMLIKGLFFASEAALVGGVADWFAVTALFKKPLGFPYHTALLPRQREKFISACAKMIQDEFFAKRKLLIRIKKMNIVAQIFLWVENCNGKTIIVEFLFRLIQQAMEKMDREKLTILIEKEILEILHESNQEEMYQSIAKWYENNNMEDRIFNKLLGLAKEKLERPDTKIEIEYFLRIYVEQKTSDVFGGLLSIVAQLTNVVNFSEAAEILHRQLLILANQLLEKDHPLRQQLIGQVKESATSLVQDEEWLQLIEYLKCELSKNLLLKNEIDKALQTIEALISKKEIEQSSALTLEHPVIRIITEQIDQVFSLLRTDSKLKEVFESFVCELLCRSALEAQAMIGDIVREVLKELSDAELNKLVYDKVEQDLLWIRMNGSIVGAGIGIMIFGFLEIIQ